MPWKEMSVMSQRREFVQLAQAEAPTKGAFVAASGSAQRLDTSGLGGSVNGARQAWSTCLRWPHHSPARTPAQIEQAVLSARVAHPAWGARKLRR